jgi:hypothetical protein
MYAAPVDIDLLGVPMSDKTEVIGTVSFSGWLCTGLTVAVAGGGGGPSANGNVRRRSAFLPLLTRRQLFDRLIFGFSAAGQPCERSEIQLAVAIISFLCLSNTSSVCRTSFPVADGDPGSVMVVGKLKGFVGGKRPLDEDSVV